MRLALERATLECASLAVLVERLEVIAIGLDETLALGKSYSFSSILYVLFVDPGGRVVDRLPRLRAPEALEARLREG